MKGLGLIGIIAAAAISAHAQQPTPEELLITPGIGIGPVKVGMKINDAIAVLGHATSEQLGAVIGPLVIERPIEAVRYTWEKIVAQTNNRGTIYAVYTHHPGPMTAQGLHVDSEASAVRSAMGEPSRVLHGVNWDTLAYYSRGISFDIGTSVGAQNYGKVFEVAVFALR